MEEAASYLVGPVVQMERYIMGSWYCSLERMSLGANEAEALDRLGL